jgi:hypothetical protein
MVLLALAGGAVAMMLSRRRQPEAEEQHIEIEPDVTDQLRQIDEDARR